MCAWLLSWLLPWLPRLLPLLLLLQVQFPWLFPLVVLLHLVMPVRVVLAVLAGSGLSLVKVVDGGEVVGVGCGHLTRESRGPFPWTAGPKGDLVVLWGLLLLFLAAP
jgi:hypothetical protein